MPSPFLPFLVLTLSSLASALPSPVHIGVTVDVDEASATTIEVEGFTVEQIARPNHVPNGVYSVYRTYQKYGVEIPQWLHEAVGTFGGELGRRATGSAVTTPLGNDIAYLTPVQIGTPPQTLNLDFDTGSSDLWVYSDLTSSTQVDGQTTFASARSSTAQSVTGATWSIQYADDSSSSGVVIRDTVSVGGLAVPNQTVELATNVSSQFTSDADIDGLLGLGFDNINTVRPNRATTFFSTGKASLDAPLFAVDLKAGAPGTYDFGFIDDSKYTGNITYTAVNTTQGFWNFTSTGYQFGSAAFTATPLPGIADTGTTLLYLPDSILSRYYATIPNSGFTFFFGGYYIPCSATDSLPDFTFGVEGARITIPGRYVNYSPLLGQLCFAGIQPSDDIGVNIFGDVALKSAYVVFEGDETPRLGFASKTLT